jgi:hypothetical protein
MNWQCPVCGPDKSYGDEHSVCPRHFCEIFPIEPEVAPEPAATSNTGPTDTAQPVGTPATAVRWDRSRCWYCGTEPPDPRNTECLNQDCHRPLTPPALLIGFKYGAVEVNPGARVELGRLGPHGQVFRSYPNVSRRHAVVGVDPNGEPWIEPLPTPNGTFLDGTEIPASVRQPLHTGHQLRFALNAEGTATVYAR